MATVTFAGHVTDRRTCAPLAGVIVNISGNYNNSSVYFNTEVTTDSNGFYTHTQDMPSYTNGLALNSVWFKGSNLVLANFYPLTGSAYVPPSYTYILDVELISNVAVTGIVTDSISGAPLPNVNIDVVIGAYNSSNVKVQEITVTTVTDANGVYTGILPVADFFTIPMSTSATYLRVISLRLYSSFTQEYLLPLTDMLVSFTYSSVWVEYRYSGFYSNVSRNVSLVSTTHTLTIDVCGVGTTAPAIGTHQYIEGQVINISAVPSEGYAFDSWDGNVAQPNSASTTVTIGSTDTTITAIFVLVCSLTIQISGNGMTTPSSGIYSYGIGQLIDLLALPDEGWKFLQWQGDVEDPNSSSSTIFMNADKVVTAVFQLSPSPPQLLTTEIRSANPLIKFLIIKVTNVPYTGPKLHYRVEVFADQEMTIVLDDRTSNVVDSSHPSFEYSFDNISWHDVAPTGIDPTQYGNFDMYIRARVHVGPRQQAYIRCSVGIDDAE